MSKEYIERGALLKALREKSNPWAHYIDAIFVAEKFPIAADVVEVKHGRWVARARKNGVGKCCSACTTAFTFAPTPYCPNCGADMRGVNDG